VRQAACKLGLEHHSTPRHDDLDAELASGHMATLATTKRRRP
jgi:hypothetical protein